MSEHIERLKSFIEKQDPSKILNTISQGDKELKETWSQAQSNQEWLKIKSYKNVIEQIDYFERYVSSSSEDLGRRNYDKPGMLIAQYKAIRALRKWCQSISLISINKDPNYPMLSESEVDELISRLQSIIDRI